MEYWKVSAKFILLSGWFTDHHLYAPKQQTSPCKSWTHRNSQMSCYW